MVGWSSATLPIWGQTFFGGGFCIFRVRSFFWKFFFCFLGESKEPRGHMYSLNCWRVSEGPVAGDPWVGHPYLARARGQPLWLTRPKKRAKPVESAIARTEGVRRKVSVNNPSTRQPVTTRQNPPSPNRAKIPSILQSLNRPTRQPVNNPSTRHKNPPL